MDSNAALAQLQQQQAQSQNPNDILATQRQQLGVQGAQDTVTGLRGAINNTTKLLQQVAPSVMGRTGSSLVTDAQATRQIANEQAPLNTTLSNDTTQYNQSNEDLSKLQDEATQAASGIYQGQQDKLSYAQNLYNTLYQKEKDAQAAQQAESDRQEQIREFDAQLAAQARAAANSGITLGGSSTPSAAPSLQDQAYSNVQSFLTKGRAAAESDYAATLKSANYGNALDKLKVQLYNKAGIGVPQILNLNQPGLSSYNVPGLSF